MLTFGAKLIKNDYLISGIKKAQDEARSGNIDLAYKFYSALNTIKEENPSDTFEIKPIDGIITRGDAAKPQAIIINGNCEYKTRCHKGAGTDDGSQCIAGILNFAKEIKPNKLSSLFDDYISAKETADAVKFVATEEIMNELDIII